MAEVRVSKESVERFEIDSRREGKHLVIFGAIHGNEICGPTALREFITELQSPLSPLVRGRLTIFPVCNPRAFESNTRYIEENLNRVFDTHAAPTSYERRLATEICPYVQKADALLDIHSMQSKGEPFVFLNSPTLESEKLCEALGTHWILRGWPEVYATRPELLQTCTQTFADRCGIPNALIECGSHTDPEAARVASAAIRGALAHFGMIDAAPPPRSQRGRHLKMTTLHTRESPNDSFPKVWKNFESFFRGDLLATRADGEKIYADSDGIMILPSPISALGTEWFYTGHAMDI
ncbi:MAG: succinylglutamate desuccinylase/aspartoacylase family protein [Bdellovibrionota bacterium]